MSKEQKDPDLRFGQGILIEGFKEKGEDIGFLTAQGFADIKAKYQTYDDILFFKNYRNAIFQILPAGNFELNDQLEKALIENEGAEDTPNIKILRARAESEKKQFELNIANKQKQKVHFGNNVIFKHIDSESYISGTIKPSNGSNGAFTVVVSDKLSESLIFRLEPYRSFEFMDMPIPFDSPIKILNLFNNGYLTFQKLGIGESGRGKDTYIQKKAIESNQSYKIPVKTNSLKSSNYEIVTHFVDLSCLKQAPMPWRFKLHVTQVENDVLIQHDIVYLEHTQNKGVLTIHGDQDIILKESHEQGSDGLLFFECLWEIQTYSQKEESAYILRHLMSGRTLDVREDQLGIKPVLFDISKGKEELQDKIGYVKLVLAKKQGGQINSESFVNVAWGDGLILQIDESEFQLKESVRKDQSEGFIDLNKMASLYKKNAPYAIKKLTFRKSVTQTDCFKIMEIENDLKKELLFALSFHSVIINLKEDLQWGAIEAAKKIDHLRMNQVTSKISEIKTFIKNCSEEQAAKQYNLPLKNRQNICLDLGLGQLLFEMLYFMKMNLKEDIFSDKHNQRQKFVHLYNTLYETIKQLIRNNIQFKKHISKWFEFILEDVIQQNEQCHLDLLKELLRNNAFFVNNFVNERLIHHLTENCIKSSQEKQKFSEKFIETKYLQIFRLFCITDDTVNTANQTLILEHFFNYLKKKNSIYDIQIIQENGQIYVQAALDKKTTVSRPFKEFYQVCQESETLQTAWAYFCQFLNLIADMTQGRNKITETDLCTYFTIDILGDLFENEELNEAEVPVIRLIHYLYAENEKFYPVERKRKILNYNELNDTSKIVLATHSQLKPWQPPFDKILNVLLMKLSTYGPIDPQRQIQNNTLLTLLKFLWETVHLGFWQDKEQIKQILTNILRILQLNEKYTPLDYQSKLILESRENILMNQCKLQCLKTIELISDYDTDFFVRIIASKFKNFEIPEKKFSLKGLLDNSAMFQIKSDPQMIADFLKTLPSQEEIQPIVETNICQQMIQISNYMNPQLTSKAISIMDKALQTKKKALKQFKELIIISEDQRLMLVSFMEEHRNKFFILDDPNIVAVDVDNQTNNYFMVYDEKNLGIMEILFLLSQLMKNQNSILNIENIKSIHESGIFNALGTQRLINFTGERSSTNRMKQQIVYASNLHLKVLNFIFNCSELPETELATKLLHMSYYFIVSLIQNFNQIKNLMQKHIEKVLVHIKKNVGCIDFLKEMYDNNKTMLYNESAVFSLIKQICEDVEHEHQGSYYKSKLLDFFRYLIYCNGRSLRMNQIQILKIMQDDSYTSIMIKPTIEDIQQLIVEYEADNPDEFHIIKMSPKLTYYCTYFQILASLIDNNNDVNIGKLVKRFPFDTVVAYIRQSKKCWPLKRNIRAFLNRLYYFRPQIQTHIKTIVGEEVDNIIEDLNLFIEEKVNPDVGLVEKQAFQNPVRFTYIESYHYLLIEQCLFTLFQLTTKEKVKNQIVTFLRNNCQVREDHEIDLIPAYNFMRITERLGWLQRYFTENRNTYSNSMIKFILAKLKLVFLGIDEAILYAEGIPAKFKSIDKEDPNFSNVKDLILMKIIDGKISQFYEEKSPKIRQPYPLSYLTPTLQRQEKKQKVNDKGKLLDVIRNIFKREKRDFLNEDQRILYNLQQLISSLKLCPNAQKYILDEYNQKVNTYSTKEDIYEYLSRIISMNSIDKNALSDQLKIFFLQFITGLIEQANQAESKQPEAKPEVMGEGQPQEQPLQQQFAYNASIEAKVDVDEWEAQNWDPNAKKIQQVQNKLKKSNLGKFITDLLKEDIVNNIELANAILLCATAYLLGGNEITQKSIIDEIAENDSQNKVFENIERLIDKLGKLIRKNIDENSVKEEETNAEFTPTTVDNYDYYDVQQRYTLRKNVFEPNSTDEHLYNKLCITTYRRTFKFLQLICQNNNIKGKHLIREQEKKNIQFNFIEITTKQLRNLFQIYCKEIKEVPLFLLDFILEVTQIPVSQNQQALMHSTFFQDLSQLGNFFSDPKNFEDRNFHQEDKKDVQEIYFKSFKIMLSNFQGNNPDTFSTLDKKLDPFFLLNVLSNKLQSMNIKNRADLIAHINQFNNQDFQEEIDGVVTKKKKTGFDDDILNILDGMTIFLKLRDILKKENSLVITQYEKYKKEQEEKEFTRVLNNFRDQNPNQEQAKAKAHEFMNTEYKCMFAYLQKCLISIQITNQGREQTLYFPNFPVFKSLSGNLRDFIMSNVERGSHRDKIVSLLGYTDAVKQKMEYSYNLNKYEHITQDNMNNSFWWAAVFSIIICFYMMYFYHIAIEYQSAEYYSFFPIGLIRFGLSLVQLTFSFYFVYYWYKLRLWFDPERVSRPKKDQEEKTKIEAPVEEALADLPEPEVELTTWGKIWKTIMHWYGFVKSYIFPPESQAAEGQEEEGEQKIYKCIQFWRLLIFFASSVIGTFAYPPMFFVHLIDIFAQEESLGRILKSVIVNIKSLMYVSLMGVVFVLIFCTVTFSNYMKNVYGQGEGIDEMCTSVLDCVSSLYVSGAIGQTMQTFEMTRFIYDIIYTTFFGMLFSNIVSGIMLDAFASMREAADELSDDKQNKCYICNISRQSLQKQKEQTFKEHTRGKHFLWNYIFYIYVLELKNETDYTGIEYYISNQYKVPDEDMEVSWIPDKEDSTFEIEAVAEELKAIIGDHMTSAEGLKESLDKHIGQFNELAATYLE